MPGLLAVPESHSSAAQTRWASALAPPPAPPTDLTVTRGTSDGALTLRWKAANPAGTGGTSYIIRRRLPGESEFSFMGVSADCVEGVDITVPVYQFAETHYLADAVVTLAYKLKLFALAGRINNSAFEGFAAGECLFLGAAGTKRGSGDWEIGYRFASSPNGTAFAVGDMNAIGKRCQRGVASETVGSGALSLLVRS